MEQLDAHLTDARVRGYIHFFADLSKALHWIQENLELSLFSYIIAAYLSNMESPFLCGAICHLIADKPFELINTALIVESTRRELIIWWDWDWLQQNMHGRVLNRALRLERRVLLCSAVFTDQTESSQIILLTSPTSLFYFSVSAAVWQSRWIWQRLIPRGKILLTFSLSTTNMTNISMFFVISDRRLWKPGCVKAWPLKAASLVWGPLVLFYSFSVKLVCFMLIIFYTTPWNN